MELYEQFNRVVLVSSGHSSFSGSDLGSHSFYPDLNIALNLSEERVGSIWDLSAYLSRMLILALPKQDYNTFN